MSLELYKLFKKVTKTLQIMYKGHELKEFRRRDVFNLNAGKNFIYLLILTVRA